MKSFSLSTHMHEHVYFTATANEFKITVEVCYSRVWWYRYLILHMRQVADTFLNFIWSLILVFFLLIHTVTGTCTIKTAKNMWKVKPHSNRSTSQVEFARRRLQKTAGSGASIHTCTVFSLAKITAVVTRPNSRMPSWFTLKWHNSGYKLVEREKESAAKYQPVHWIPSKTASSLHRNLKKQP